MENVHHSRFVIFSLFQSIFPDETFLTPCGCRWELYRFYMFTSTMSYCDHFLAPWDHNLNLKLLPFFGETITVDIARFHDYINAATSNYRTTHKST